MNDNSKFLNRSPRNFTVENFTKKKKCEPFQFSFRLDNFSDQITSRPTCISVHILSKKCFKQKLERIITRILMFNAPFLYKLWFYRQYNKGVAIFTFPNMCIQQSIMIFQTHVNDYRSVSLLKIVKQSIFHLILWFYV
jgi:hypothetical protein